MQHYRLQGAAGKNKETRDKDLLNLFQISEALWYLCFRPRRFILDKIMLHPNFPSQSYNRGYIYLAFAQNHVTFFISMPVKITGCAVPTVL